MSLNIIDIASYQGGIDLDAVFRENPLDGVIVKATQGKSYVNPYCDGWVQWLIAHDKPWGFYHYLDHSDPVSEAKYFVENTQNYFRDGIPCADYEGSIVSRYGTYYLKRWLETVYQETGVKPLIYCNLSTVQGDKNGFKTLAEDGYQLWLAQYANTRDQYGFLDNPWQRGSYAPFDKYIMHQYSGTGRLNGYDGHLDLDKFYGTVEDWNALAGRGVKPEPEPEPEPEPGPSVDWREEAISRLKATKSYIEKQIEELESLK